MDNITVISKSQLEGASRLDAEYYQPEYLNVTQHLSKLKTITLQEFCRISDGDHSKIPGFVETDGIRYLRAKDLQNFLIDDSDPVYVRKDYFQKIRRSHVKPFDIVLSIMGTVGNLAVVLPKYGTITANRAVSIISPKSEDLFSPFFLAAYLESKYGVAQRERESMGGVQHRVNLDDLQRIRVPFIPRSEQKEVNKVFQEAVKHVENSEHLYDQARGMLLAELGLTNFQPPDDLSYTVQFSDTQSADRFDAEYFQPKYDALVKRLKDHNPKPLPEVVQSIRPDFVPHAEPTRTFRYVELADIHSPTGVIDGYSEFLGNEVPSRARRILKTDDIIVSSVEGSLEKAALVDADHDGCLASTGFFQFRSKSYLPEVLLVLAKSLVLQMQLGKQATGTILSAVPNDALKDIYLPEISRSTQEKITNLVRQSHESRKKAKQLFEESKHRVEEVIEKEAKHAKT